MNQVCVCHVRIECIAGSVFLSAFVFGFIQESLQDVQGGQKLDAVAMLSMPSEAAPCPHGYLYTLDLPRIHRILRPVKAKIAAVHHAIKSAPSFGYTSTITSNGTSSSALGEISSVNKDTRTKTTKHQYGQPRSHRSHHESRQFTGGHKPASTKQQQELDGYEMAPRPCAQNGDDALVKRFHTSIRDLLKDVVEKVWWHPFCEDHDLPLNTDPASAAARGLTPSRNTLGIHCAFAVGRIIANIPEDSEKVEKYYHIMPPYMRR